ncbi:hypothetical protein BLA29_003159 [Euroglyphus maynei]|uniref:Uncharacterized protein n=1 Tax=Euroglyphus maynei TaxID=6958 RepID=A0A1Y3B6Y2_EURMA|nr:hypothetical protein BLA29_003159 [Euroglyphus maynei]
MKEMRDVAGRAQRYCKLSAFTGLGEKTSPITPTTGADLSPTASTLSFPPPYTEATAADKTCSINENSDKLVNSFIRKLKPDQVTVVKITKESKK